ncbi:MAG TPA: DNA ligase [Pseudoxanthomonas sp.]|nr:DNA ligase [Pseudoxanthomonas sp.]
MNLRIVLLLLLSCLPSLPSHAGEPVPPRVMLATDYRNGIEVADYWVSEKLDGVRGRWDGQRLVTRTGQAITPPKWFTAGWPRVAMDGELWIGHGRFDEVSGLVRAGAADDRAWRRVRFMVFDLPAHAGSFDARVMRMRALTTAAKVAWLQPVAQFRMRNAIELEARLRQVSADGGEGLMLHRRGALYRAGRSDDLVKYKLFDDAEARVLAHVPGKGKYTGMMGALVMQLPDGRRFRLGSGFTDAQRANPPPPGSLVTYRYNGLTSKGLPRFARFQRIRLDPPPPDPR